MYAKNFIYPVVGDQMVQKFILPYDMPEQIRKSDNMSRICDY